jgi:hypothetical protein
MMGHYIEDSISVIIGKISFLFPSMRRLTRNQGRDE